ncbi:4Fe-4S binding domain protein [archaeon BMS3Abin16]|nr:4Fe-4S binding domain protein [archaeon BMS3Abin16]
MGIDLLEIKLVKRLANSRTFRPLLLLISLAAFVVLILSGLIGTPVGNKNASIVLVWILWFAALMIILIPLGGRIWCLACPIPSLSEWISRGAIVTKSDRIANLGLKWPKRLDNIWMQNFAFLGVAIFSPLILTRPRATAYALLLFMFLALIVDMSFKKSRAGRMFCRYLCPIGGFIGIYSSLGALEVRSKDKAVCRKCSLKTCMKGNERGYGCPWQVYPGGLEKNAYCGLCLECIKSCAYQNMTVQTRMPGKDLLNKPRLDEAFKGFIMLGSAGVYSAAYFGWWNGLKNIINFSDDIFFASAIRWGRVGAFAALLIGVTLVALPAVHMGFAWLTKTLSKDDEQSLRKIFTEYAYFAVPLGFMAWIGFVAGMLMINGSYIISTVSDPFGFGWNLFGTAGYSWTPYFSGLVPYVQFASILAGGVMASIVTYGVSKKHFKDRAFLTSLPVALEIAVLSALMVILNVMP